MKNRTFLFKGLILMLLMAVIFSCGKDDEQTPLPSTLADFSFSGDNNFNIPCNVQFTNMSLLATSYQWDFGNGQSSTDENPVMRYETAGTFTVTLTVGVTHDLYYNKNVKSKTIVIRDPLAGKTRKFYFTDRAASRVKYFELNDQAPILQEFGHTGLDRPYGMVIDTLHDRVYVSDFRGNLIYSYDMDGFDLRTVIDVTSFPALNGPVGMLVIDDKLYWAQEGGIFRCDLDGSNPETWMAMPGSTAPEMPLDMEYDAVNQHIYFTNDKYDFSGGIYRVKLDGSGMTLLVSGTDGGGLAIDFSGGKMYYADYEKGICMANLDGSGEVVIAPDMISNFCWGMEVGVENGKVYWGDKAADNLVRCNLDGSGQEIFISGVDPHALALDKYR